METTNIIIAVLIILLILSFSSHLVIVKNNPTPAPVPVPVPVPVSRPIVGGCAGTIYGCCPNGVTAKMNNIGTNCYK